MFVRPWSPTTQIVVFVFALALAVGMVRTMAGIVLSQASDKAMQLAAQARLIQ